MSTKNEDAIARRISSGCKDELPVVEVGGSGLEDVNAKNVMRGT